MPAAVRSVHVAEHHARRFALLVVDAVVFMLRSQKSQLETKSSSHSEPYPQSVLTFSKHIVPVVFAKCAPSRRSIPPTQLQGRKKTRGPIVAVTASKNPIILDTLAAAHAADSQFGCAQKAPQKALVLASGKNDSELSQAIRRRLELYKHSRTYRENPTVSAVP